MSGGRFEYLDSRLITEIFGYCDKPWNALEDREISELTWDLLNLIENMDVDECEKEAEKAADELLSLCHSTHCYSQTLCVEGRHGYEH